MEEHGSGLGEELVFVGEDEEEPQQIHEGEFVDLLDEFPPEGFVGGYEVVEDLEVLGGMCWVEGQEFLLVEVQHILELLVDLLDAVD